MIIGLRDSRLQTSKQKAFVMKENEWIICFHKYEFMLGVITVIKKKVLLALVSKRASEELSSDSSCLRIEGTFGIMLVTRRGGALGTAGAGMVGKF